MEKLERTRLRRCARMPQSSARRPAPSGFVARCRCHHSSPARRCIPHSPGEEPWSGISRFVPGGVSEELADIGKPTATTEPTLPQLEAIRGCRKANSDKRTNPFLNSSSSCGERPRTIHVKTVFGGASHYGEGARSLVGQKFRRDHCNPDDTLKPRMCFAYSIEFNAQPVDNGRV
jgi:hypothetical protein